jgi:DNA-directed RNA polymerase specialized sigma24 family protein
MKIITFPGKKPGMNREQFTEVYDLYASRIYQFIYYKTYHKETAEDLTSSTFLRAFENLHQFNPERGSIGAWIYQIARNLVTDHYRAKKKTIGKTEGACKMMFSRVIAKLRKELSVAVLLLLFLFKFMWR